ncbi:MAG: sensor histidine kinase [Ktedonobacterales bacterium]
MTHPNDLLSAVAPAAAESPAAGAARELPRRGMTGFERMPPLATRMFVAIWVAFAVATLVSYSSQHPAPQRLSVAIAVTALFVTVYVWLVVTGPLGEIVRPPLRRSTIALLVLLWTLSHIMLFAYDLQWGVLFIFVSLATAASLPPWLAVRAIGLLTLLTLVGGLITGAGWGVVLDMLPVGGSGLGIVGLALLFDTIHALRAAREELARLAVTEERLRFARDLHDLLGHSLSLIALKSELAGRLVARDPRRAEAEVGDIERVAREALREVREAVADYRHPTLESELAGAREVLAAAGIACVIEETAGELPPRLDGVLGWAVREGMTNVIRHSHAQHCTIRIEDLDGLIVCTITDDGVGATAAGVAARGGSGLVGLSERVAACGGSVVADAASDQRTGFRLRIELPTAATAAAATIPAKESLR